MSGSTVPETRGHLGQAQPAPLARPCWPGRAGPAVLARPRTHNSCSFCTGENTLPRTRCCAYPAGKTAGVTKASGAPSSSPLIVSGVVVPLSVTATRTHFAPREITTRVHSLCITPAICRWNSVPPREHGVSGRQRGNCRNYAGAADDKGLRETEKVAKPRGSPPTQAGCCPNHSVSIDARFRPPAVL